MQPFQRFRHDRTLLLIAALLLARCAPAAPPSSVVMPPPQISTPLPSSSEQQVREAFGVTDLDGRLAGILNAVKSFLRDAAERSLPDDVAAAYLTEAALASGQPVLVQPTYVRRADDLVVVALPGGLGLYLYDLSTPTNTAPLEISRWVVGLSALEVIWGYDEVGVFFTTLGADGVPRVHYALLERKADGGWQIAWLSDEEPDWWFNAVGGTLDVSPDLSQLIVTGQATRTTEAFYEQAGEPCLSFRLVWQHQGDGYVLSPSPQAYTSRQAWLWNVAEPSPYATLVEFVEHMQAGDTKGAAQLVGDPEVLTAARDFGLHLAERRYQVVEAAPDRIVFRDVHATLAATFLPPLEAAGKWLIAGITPVGAVQGNASSDG